MRVARLQPARSAPLVGRDRELARILEWTSPAATPNQGVVLVSGAAGLGRSRLLEAAATRLRSSGVQILSGAATDAAIGEWQYHPLSQAFQGRFRRAEPGLADLRPALASIALSGEPDGESFDAAPGGREEVLLVCEALATACGRIAAAGPAVLILDDLHWAAAAVWQAVGYIGRWLTDAPFTILVAADSWGGEPVAAAGPVLAELAAAGRLQHLPISPLQEPELAELAAGLLGGRVGSELTALLAAEAQGSPLVVDQLVRELAWGDGLVESGGGWSWDPERVRPVPGALAASVPRRVAQLPAGAARALLAGAVHGAEFHTGTLCRMTGMSANLVQAGLDQAGSAGLIELVGEDLWCFRHSLIRDALLAAWPASRAELHARAAITVVAEAASGFERLALGAAAHHWWRAGQPEKAAAAASGAASAAARGGARGDALVFWRLARRLREESAGAGRGELAGAIRAHAMAALAAGETAEAEAAFRAGLELATMLGDHRLHARLLVRLSALCREREAVAEAHRHAAGALELIRVRGLGPELEADALLELAALEAINSARHQLASEHAEHAVELAGRSGNPGLRARALISLAHLRAGIDQPDAGRAPLEAALELALAAGDLRLAGQVCAELANIHYGGGRLRLARHHSLSRLELAERRADLFEVREAQTWIALIDLSRGEWETARRLLDGGEAALTRLPDPGPLAFTRVVRGLLALRMGDPEVARVSFGRALAHWRTGGEATLAGYAGLEALALAEAGDRPAAGAAIESVEVLLRRLPGAALPARAARVALGLACARLGDVDRATGIETRLREHAGDFHFFPARLALAEMAALRGDPYQALSDLDQLEEHCRTEGLQPDLAAILALRSRLTTAQPRPSHPGRSDRSLPARAGILTRRESEVLDLVAAGMGDAEIAGRLGITRPTVRAHIRRIGAKLGTGDIGSPRRSRS